MFAIFVLSCPCVGFCVALVPVVIIVSVVTVSFLVVAASVGDNLSLPCTGNGCGSALLFVVVVDVVIYVFVIQRSRT